MQKNIAFIDGQNLFMGTSATKPAWRVDLVKFRRYLREKYKVEKAYYYMGFVQDKNQDLYDSVQEAGFILRFRKHNSAMKGKKKGNVDSDIIFDVMHALYKNKDFSKIILVSGDGDYKMLVDFLIEEGVFEKILFPNKRFASSLYKDITSRYFAHLDDVGVRRKVELQQKRRRNHRYCSFRYQLRLYLFNYSLEFGYFK